MSYRLPSLAQVEPPPLRPVPWVAVLGWGVVVAATAGLFYAVANFDARPARPVRRNRRRASRRVRKNLFDQHDPAYVSGQYAARFGMKNVPMSDEEFMKSPAARAPRAIDSWRMGWRDFNSGHVLPMLKNARRTSRPAKPKFSELGIVMAVGTVRSSSTPKKADVLPPGVAAKFKKLPPGIYKYGWGPKKGEVIQKFKSASLRGALTSARIGAKAVHEYHWVVDNFDPSFPVVIRGIDDQGKTFFRVEEFAQQLERAPARVMRSRASR